MKASALPFAPVVALLLLAAAPARGQVVASGPCGADIKKFCGHVEAGEGRVVTCLHRHEKELAPACKAQVDADYLTARTTIQEISRACRADAAEFCTGVTAGNGRMLGCLDDHAPRLSTPCQAEVNRIAAARAHVEAVVASCKADAVRLCPGIPHHGGMLVRCLDDNRKRLSADCDASSVGQAMAAAALVHALEEINSTERRREVLQILQGLNTVAFSRSQVLIQFDSFQDLGGKANAGRFLFNPQSVFGGHSEFALQLKVPVTGVYPSGGAPAQFGLGAVNAAMAWNFLETGPAVHYVALGVQLPSASSPAVGAPWAVIPSYAVGIPLSHWLTFTLQVQWLRSLGSWDEYKDSSLLVVEPILAVNLPGRSYLALDAWMGWDFTTGVYAPTLKGVAGIFTDRDRSLSISAWYQATLTQAAVDVVFKYNVGMVLAYFFDW